MKKHIKFQGHLTLVVDPVAVVPFIKETSYYTAGYIVFQSGSLEVKCPLKIGNLLWDNMTILDIYATLVGH